MVKMRLLAGILAFLLFSSFINSCIGDTGSKTVVVFKGGETDFSYKGDNGAITKCKPNTFRISGFVGGLLEEKEFLAVFADAHYDESQHLSFIAPALRTSYGNYKNLSDAEDFTNATLKKEENEALRSVIAVINKNKIYVLASRFDNSNNMGYGRSSSTTTSWDAVMFFGSLVKSTVSGRDDMTVTWEKKKSLKSLLEQTQDGKLVNGYFVGGVGNGIVMKNGTIVFPVQITHKAVGNAKTQASSIIYSSDNGSTWYMGNVPEISASECSVVEWGNEKLLLSARSILGVSVVYESNDMGSTWTESSVFTAVWKSNTNGNYPVSQGSVLTAPVDGENVLLFLRPLKLEETDISDILQVWMSDGKRIVCVGTISKNEKEEHTGNSILANVGNNLYVTHEINLYKSLSDRENTGEDGEKVIAIRRLPQLFESATKTVRAWRELDEWLETKKVSTKWLVGYLGTSEKESKVWTDNYKCVNATISGGKSVAGGFCFSGESGSGAKWPVSNNGQNDVYAFTAMEFTLAATVKIHSTGSAGDDSLIGARKSWGSSSTLIGLGFTHERQWYTLQDKDSKEITHLSFDLDKEYHVALTFGAGVAFVYVNGVNITNGRQTDRSNHWIDHFYMGGKGQSSAATGSSCTVKNVMLFNQSLKQEQINQLWKASSNGKLDELMQTEEPTSVQIIPETVSTNEETSKLQKPKTVSTNEETSELQKPKTVSTNEETSEPQITNTVSNKPTSEKQIQKTMSIKKAKSDPQIHKAVLTTEPKEPTVTENKKVSNRNEDGKRIDHYLRDYHNATIETIMNPADGAAVSVVFVPLICFFCFIVLHAKL